jgi:hypothetical protein
MNKELEETAEKYSQELLEAKTIQPHEKTWIKSMFIYIANWQAERSYTKEDIENIWNEFVKEEPPINNGASSDFLVYLKQFKKK